MHLNADVLIVGSGFGGSLTALLLDRIGLRPVLLDRGTHPRFAIGESSTPAANLILRDLARRYDLPRLEPLAKYGTWQIAYREIVCGPKRGFSYFSHIPQRRFIPNAEHANELLVAASPSQTLADTQWLRSDVDAFVVREAEAAGIPYVDRVELSVAERWPEWRLSGTRHGAPVTFTGRFLIDASGEGQFLPKALGLESDSVPLCVRSRGLFGHFTGLKPWQTLLEQNSGQIEDHPFPCDQAAVHQVLEEGWMWQLRFNNGVTSAGFALDLDRCPAPEGISPADEWNRLMEKYPSLDEQFAEARLVAPEGGLRRTGRLQRLIQHCAGENWALLPHTAGFIDPLHSTGIAQTMCGIERLLLLLQEHWNSETLSGTLQKYAETVRSETHFVDQLVRLCYQSLGRFDLLSTSSMLYFLTATTYERRRLCNELNRGAAFLCADDPQLQSIIRDASALLQEYLQSTDPQSGVCYRERIAQLIDPLNTARLCDPTARNMYHYTALPPDTQ